MSKTQARKQRHQPPARRASWLPLALIVAGVVVLGGLAWAALGSGLGGRPSGQPVPVEVTGAPRLKVDRQREDLGEVPLGQTVEVSFQLSNVGDQPLRFTDVPYVTVAEGC
jgi:multidrug efflux pump subunit AcrA (membrane-fusion protein)